MLEAIDRFRSEAEKRFSEICMLSEVFGFFDLHGLLRSENIEEDMNKFKNIYADDVNFSELSYEIAWFNRPVQSSDTAFKNDATALDVLQWLTNIFYVNQHLFYFCVLRFTSLLLFLLQIVKKVFQSLN